jgi:hypothetical protein
MWKPAAIVALAAALGLAAPVTPERDERAPGRPAVRAPDGLLVLGVLSPERAIVADPRTGEARERRLPGGTLCHGPVLAAGGRVILSGSRASRPVALSLPLTLAGRGRSLGRADTFAASAAPGRLWIARWSRSGTPRTTLREVGATGGPRRAARHVLPDSSSFEGAVDGGFLLGRRHGLALWDDRAGELRRGFPGGWLLATSPAGVAWCRGPCRRVRVWSPAGERTLAPPRGFRPDQAGATAFSPGGGRLAVPLRSAGSARAGVVDLATGGWTVVPGARLAGYESIAWSPSGRWLYFTGTRHRVLAWRPGASRPVRLPIRTHGTVMSIATTPAAG